MIPIICCSIVAVGVVAYKLMTISKSLVLPQEIVSEVENIDQVLATNDQAAVMGYFQGKDSSLARLCVEALKNAEKSQAQVQDAVQSAAREEIVKMNSGMPVLEVVITIAPLIGLLGTASGLVIVFANVGQGADSASVGQGIAMALNTTVAGLAVAVPTVVAHSHFSRKIETMSARLEVLMGKVTSACYEHIFLKKN